MEVFDFNINEFKQNKISNTIFKNINIKNLKKKFKNISFNCFKMILNDLFIEYNNNNFEITNDYIINKYKNIKN
jgi:hypothetical protein